MLIFGERHLRTVLARYAVHYSGQRRIDAAAASARPESPVPDPVHGDSASAVLGGLINEYEPAAETAGHRARQGSKPDACTPQ
jgi:hypothetical protein